MAKVLLHRHEVEERALPFVCLRCGRPAHLWKAKQFLLASRYGAVGKLTRVEVPLCSARRSHWLGRGLFAWAVGSILLAGFFAGLLAVAEPQEVPPRWREPLQPVFGVCFLGLILWVPVMLVLHLTSVRARTVTADDITLAGVSEEFITKLREYRRMSPAERKAARRARREPGRSPRHGEKMNPPSGPG